MKNVGTLKFEDFGFSMPVTDQSFPSPPSIFRDCEQFGIFFEMDYDSVKHRLPEPLEFYGETPSGMLLCSNFGFVSDSSPFLEFELIYHVSYEGKPFDYVINCFVSGESGMTVGREVYGYPKKMAHMEIHHKNELVTMTADRPPGMRLLTAMVKPLQPMEPDVSGHHDSLCLKVIPGPVTGGPPQVCQLVGVEFYPTTNIGSDGVAEYYNAEGHIEWGSASPFDPWHETSITKITSAYYTRLNAIIPNGYVVHDYLK